MISKLLDDISANLYAHFKTENIYLEQVEQKKEITPCFFLMPISELDIALIGNRAKRNITIDVMYKTETMEQRTELLTVANQLYSVLRFLYEIDENNEKTTKRVAFANSMRHEIVDDVLHFIVNYKVIVYYTEDPSAIMENLDIEVGSVNG